MHDLDIEIVATGTNKLATLYKQIQNNNQRNCVTNIF